MPAKFQRHTSPEARKPPILMIIMCYRSLSFLVIGIYEIKNVKIWCEHILRTLLCSQFALTNMPSQFQGQTNPEARILPILMIIVWYSSLSLVVIGVSEVENV